MSCYCDGEVYYCEDCRLTLSRMEVKERRVLDNVRHHGHDHADCPLCGAELCDAPHVESCNRPLGEDDDRRSRGAQYYSAERQRMA